MNLFSSDREIDAAAAALVLVGLTATEALALAKQRVEQRRAHVGSITKVLPAAEYGPIGGKS